MMDRRTIRRYTTDNIPKEIIDRIIQGALTAPSGRNLRPVEIIVIKDKEKLEKLSKARGPASQWIKGANVGICLISKKDLSGTWASDSAIVATFIQLLAQEEDLGSCWIHLHDRIADDGSVVEENVRNILDIPEEYHVFNMLSIGYPDEEKNSHKEDELDYNRISFDSFESKE